MGLVKKIFGTVLCFGLLVAGFLFSKVTLESEDQDCLFEEVIPARKTITFLMGEDKRGYQYFKLAEEHFLFDEKEKTDVMVKTCRSLEDVINFLNNSSEPMPWSTIHVVLHGNPYSGLSLPIVNEGPRASPKKLLKASIKNPLPALNGSTVDSLTKINFWACGIGKNPFINIALEQFFELPDGHTPEIYSSPHFVVFKNLEDGKAPRRVKAYYWPYVFKRGYRPGDHEIAQALKEQFPDVEVNWKQAVNEKSPLENKEFQNSFHIPVSWTVIYPTKKSRPSVKTENEKMKWIKSQKELMTQVEESNIPMDKFTWTVNKIIHTKANGDKVPAIKAIGMATVLCVLETEI